MAKDTARKLEGTNIAQESKRIFDPADIPPSLRPIPDLGRVFDTGKRRLVVWGWREWIALAPRLQQHIRKQGRKGLAGLIIEQQKKLIHAELQKTTLSIATLCSTKTKPDVLSVIAFIVGQTSTETLSTPKPAKAKPTLTVVTILPKIKKRDLVHKAKASMPIGLRRVPDEGEIVALPSGLHRVRWGWTQWRALQPVMLAHARQFGRLGLSRAICDAQAGLLPPDMQRTGKALSVACQASKTDPDVVAVIEYLAGEKLGAPTGKAAPPRVPSASFEHLRGLSARRQEPPRPALIADIDGSRQPMPFIVDGSAILKGTPINELDAFLATPLRAFLPGLKAFFAEQIQAALVPHTAMIAEVVRKAVIDVVGAPLTAPASPAAPEPLQAREAPEGPKPSTEASAQPVEAAAPLAPLALIREEPEEPAHDLETQLSIAAKNLGIEPQAKREAILIVGVHPKVEQEVERFFGKAFRFYFKRPDAFNSSNDIPASADAVLMARKPHLPSEIAAFFRRNNMPNERISNDSNSVLWALKKMFPESTGHLRPLQ